MVERASTDIDALLRSFLQATDDSESEHLLATLVTDHAEPIIREIVGRKLHVHISPTGHTPQNRDAEEIYGEALFHLIRRLHFLKVNAANKINSFHSYVSVIAQTACYSHLRQKYPQRHRLKSRLRYILTHQPGLGLWRSDENEWICGFVESRDQKMAVSPKWLLHDLRRDPGALEQAGLISRSTKPGSPVHLVTAIFKVVGSPVELDDLVDIVADLQGIKDQPLQTETDHEKAFGWHERFPDPRLSPASETEQRVYLQRLWTEICALPLDQRTALLLNLKDEQGRDITTLFSHIRIATLRQIAEALGITSDAFAELWNDLPLDDATIAKRLGLTRQQVISLRQSARRRLSRRMEAFSKGI